MVNSTGTHAAPTIAKRLTGLAASVGASVALAVGLATPAFASTGAATESNTMTPRAAAIQAAVYPLADAGAGTGTAAAATPPSGAASAAASQQAEAAKAAALAQAAAAAKAATQAVPTAAQLMPHGSPSGWQESFQPSATQLANAKAIVKAGQEMKLPPRAWVIAVATSMQESKLINLGNLGSANDHDSLGLFQQRPSSGWGTPAECTDPDHAAKAFYSALAKVPDYQNLPLTSAAQQVQVSAYPSAYAKWEAAAAHVVAETFGG